MPKKEKKIMTKPKRHHISDLLDLKERGLIDDEKINELRQQRLVIEPRRKEIRYVRGTTLIPHFYYKNATVNEITPDAIKLKMAIEAYIKDNTISKTQYDEAIAIAEKELEAEKLKADKIKKKTPVKKI